MIIKSKSYKTIKSFKTVTLYILRESEQDQSFVVTRFVKGNPQDIEALEKQFIENEKYRIHKRKNSVRLYMDIISFHADDKNKLRNEDLQKIAEHYIELRAPKSIAVATVHRHEKEHVHLHICFSGIAYRTGKSIRISKSDFTHKVKIPMEEFQKQHFPQLQKSIIDHHRSVRKKKSR